MGVEIDGRLGSNDYRLRKLTAQLREKDKEIDAFKQLLEMANLKAEAEEEKLKKKIEKLKEEIRSLEGRLKYYRSMRKDKPAVETKEKS